MVVLLEREVELERLAGAAEDAVGGRGCLVLVGGEAGIGKTTLVRAFEAQLPDGVGFVWSACEALSVPVPLEPLRELAEAADGSASAGDDHVAVARSVFRLLAQRAPVVAVIEDAHWADPLTLDVLRILARRVEHSGIVVVVTYRDDEVGAHPALGLLLGDLATAPAALRVGLRPLSRAAVGELAGSSGLDSARLLDATAGNPFLVVEAIAAGGLPPASVRDAALARAGRLSSAARQVVDAGAVIGQRFDAALLESVVGACSEAVEEALARGVLVADQTALGFRHELIREALEQSVSPPRRAELHARVFHALAGQASGADNARLAHHAELGGLAQEAVRHAIDAAGEAERVGALRETYLQAERALRLGHSLDQAARFELLVQFARASNFANPDLEQGAQAAARAVEVAEHLRDDGRRGRALMALSYTLWSLERVLEARAAAEQAIAAFAPTGDADSLAWAHATLLRMEATSFDPEVAVEMAASALELAQAPGLEEVRIDMTISVGLARGQRGEREALTLLSDALAAARRGGFTTRMVRSYVNLMAVATALREHRCVEQVASEALPLLEERHVSALPITAIRLLRARSLMDRGEWDKALSVVVARERWWQGGYPVACAIEGLIGVRRGEPGADRLLREAWEAIVELVAAEDARHGMVRLALVESAWLRGGRAAAVRELDAARESPATGRFARSGGELALWGVRCGVQLAPPAGTPEPVLLELAGDWRAAIAAWRTRQAPYEAALAALPGDERAAREAMTALQRLGAVGAARAFARERAATGGRAVRGSRRTTLANAASLTRREQEVLEVLGTGASNAAIAAALHLSERTVAHHVSAILGKLEVPNRHLAVEDARRRGLLAPGPR